MHLYVPTRGRVGNQVTLQQLPSNWLARTTVACAPGEAASIRLQFPKLYAIHEMPTPHIAAKRARIFRLAHKSKHAKIMMLDDDLVFSVRAATWPAYRGMSGKEHVVEAYLRPAVPRDVDGVLRRMEQLLDDFAHVGIGPRYMNQQYPGELILNTKVTHAAGFRVADVLEHCKVGQVDRFEDLDLTLQMLRAGFENAVMVWAAVNEPHGYNAPGGVSLYRTQREIDRGAKRLADLHPGLVRVVKRVDRDGDTAHKGGTRLIIQWKKALGYDRVIL